MNFDLPLHPALVHIPIGLCFSLPILTLVLLFFYKLKQLKKKGLLIIVILHALLFGSSLIAEETGEKDEHIVEQVINKEFIHNHEESAELFIKACLAVMILVGLLLILPIGRYSNVAMTLILFSQLSLVFLAYRVGHSGGELVYKHGAADAHIQPKNPKEGRTEQE